MSPNTWGNTANENAESSENLKSTQASRMNVFAKKFANDVLLKTEKNKRFTMMNTYFSNETFTADQEREVMKFAWKKEEFSDLKINDINYYTLRNAFSKELVQYQTTFVMFKNKVLKNYDITHNEYLELAIENKLKDSKSLEEINDLLKSTKKLDEFINTFQENTDKEINKKDSASVLPKTFTKIINDKIESLNPEDKQEVTNILFYFKNSNIREKSFARNFSEKISELTQLWIFNKDQITELVTIFVPSISVKDAKKHLWESQENNFKNDIFKQLNLENISLSDIEKNEIFASLDDLLIDTSIFLDSDFSDLSSLLSDSRLLEKAWQEIQDTIVSVENENGVSTFADFKDALKESKINTSWLGHFKKSWIIEYITRDKEWNKKKQYYQIESDVDKIKDGRVLLINRWINVLWGKERNNATSFTQLLESLKKFKENNLLDSFNIYDADLLKQKVKNWEIIEDNDIWEFNTATQVESNINRRTQEIDPSLSEEEKNAKIQEIKEEEEIFNMNLLRKKVDHIDGKWREFWLEAWTTVSYVDEKKNTNIFTIVWSDENTITIDHWHGNKEPLLFEDFLSGFMRDPHPERVSKINTSDNLIDQLTKDSNDTWWKMTIKKWKFIQEERDDKLEKKETEFDLFIWEENINGVDGNLMKLHKIDWNKAIISYWKSDYETLKNADKKKFDKDFKDWKINKSYSIDSKKYEIPLGVFYQNIKQSWAIARNFEKEKEQAELPEAVKLKSGINTRILQNASFVDLIASGKLIIDSIESKLKEWNEEMAAIWADKIPLPEDLKTDMKTRFEQAQKKRWDEFFDRLKTVDSSVAIGMIKKIIEDKNSPEAKREWCLLFMAKQYGNLYTKKWLFENQGRFLWYTSFWGTIWDKMYRETEERAKKEGTNFTEHDLMISLLWNQCKWNPPKPKRRSKLHKEYKAMMWDGKNDEQEKWAKDASDKRTFDGRLYGVVLDELGDWGHNNAIWAIKELIGKWDDGNMPRLETLPFVMMMSWIAYDFDSDIQQKIRWPLSEGVPMISLWYLSTSSGISLYNNAVVEISKILEKDNPVKYSKMADRAKDLVIDSRKKTKKPKERMEAALNFYEEYWDILSRTLNMTASRRTDWEAKYESLLQLNAHDPEWNEILKAYYNDYVGTWSEHFKADKADEYMWDAYQSKTGAWYGGITWMAWETVFKSAFKWKPGQNYVLDSSEMLHQEFVEQLKSYQKTEFDKPTDRNVLMKEYIMAYIYWFLYNHEKNIKQNMKSPWFVFLWLLNESQLQGVTATDFKSSTSNEDRSIESQNLIEFCLNNLWSNSSNTEWFDLNNVDGYIDDVKNQTNTVFNTDNEGANDEEFEDELKYWT